MTITHYKAFKVFKASPKKIRRKQFKMIVFRQWNNGWFLKFYPWVVSKCSIMIISFSSKIFNVLSLPIGKQSFQDLFNKHLQLYVSPQRDFCNFKKELRNYWSGPNIILQMENLKPREGKDLPLLHQTYSVLMPETSCVAKSKYHHGEWERSRSILLGSHFLARSVSSNPSLWLVSVTLLGLVRCSFLENKDSGSCQLPDHPSMFLQISLYSKTALAILHMATRGEW